MTVVYADSIFLLNALMDYLLFLSTARLAGIPLRRGRYAAAALLGGAYAVVCFLPMGAFLSAAAVKASAGVLLALIAFGGEERLLRLTVLLFTVSCGMAGCVLALSLLSGGSIPHINGIFYTDVSLRVLLIAATAAYLVLTVVFRASAAHSVRGEVLPVRLSIGGTATALSALYDTGCSLKDPVSGEGVLVLSAGVLEQVFPLELRPLLKDLAAPADLLPRLYQAAPWLRPRLLPYTAVGTGKGMLLVIRTDWTEINGVRYEGLGAALAPTNMEAPALWGGTVRKGGWNDCFTAKASDRFGPAGARGHSLYRRQRHTASAPQPGTGGRAFEPLGGRVCPERTDRT